MILPCSDMALQVFNYMFQVAEMSNMTMSQIQEHVFAKLELDLTSSSAILLPGASLKELMKKMHNLYFHSKYEVYPECSSCSNARQIVDLYVNKGIVNRDDTELVMALARTHPSLQDEKKVRYLVKYFAT